MSGRGMPLLAMTAGTAFFAGSAFAEVNPSAIQPSDIIVTALTPLSDVGESALAYPAQTAGDEELEASHAGSVTDYLVRMMGGVSVNDLQGNSLQPDINYRGFTASPLLGTAQGLSLYMDGVRLNQPFGDVVSWDLIPKSAIRSISLVPGSNPLFGRNSLGGAISIRTKDGISDPGFEIEGSGGSFRRRVLEGQAGGHTTSGMDWFVSGDHLSERGWRAHSPTKAVQIFSKLGWSDLMTRVSVSGSFADTKMNGNGLQEMRLLDADRRSVYTTPDTTKNRAWMLNLTARHDFNGHLSFFSTIFARTIRSATVNGDINADALGEDIYQPDPDEQAALAASGYNGFPTNGEDQDNTPFPRWRCIANVLLNTEPNENCNGLMNRSQTWQHEWGSTNELTLRTRIAGARNALTLGVSYVRSRAHFTQSTQFGYIAPDHGILIVDGAGAFADGTQASDDAFDARVDLVGRTTSLGIYALDALDLGSLHIEMSARYDVTTIHNRDGISPGGGTGSLDTDQRFHRLNPALALRYAISKQVMIDAAIAQTSRAPSAVELGCADPASPCRLPNALAGDPPLAQVVANTVEGGVSLTTDTISARIGAFRTVSRNDILFVANDTSGFGYFRNFGNTRRQGVDVDARMKIGHFLVTGHYTFLDATFRSAEEVDGEANSSAIPDLSGLGKRIMVQRGDQLPLIPRHIFKAGVIFDPSARVSFSVDMVAMSGLLARGNENGLHAPDGIKYIGAGRTSAYAIVNAGAEFRPFEAMTLFVQINNLFDKNYANAAQLGATGFDGQGRFVAQPFAAADNSAQSSTFYAPGTPRAIQAGIRFRF